MIKSYSCRLSIFRTLSWLLFSAVLLATSASAGSLAEVTKASDNARRKIKTAISEKDSGLLSSLFTSDGAIITANGHTVSGRLKIRMAAKIAMLTGKSGTLSTVRGVISIIDDTAYETGSYSFVSDGDSSNKNQNLNGHYTIVWRLENETWKIHRVIAL